jgi:hypothetical protein
MASLCKFHMSAPAFRPTNVGPLAANGARVVPWKSNGQHSESPRPVSAARLRLPLSLLECQPRAVRSALATDSSGIERTRHDLFA